MTAAADKGEHGDALGKLFVLGADLSAYGTLLSKLEKLEDEYTKRYDKIKPDLDKAEFIRISPASLRENHPHDIRITKESPNYIAEE